MLILHFTNQKLYQMKIRKLTITAIAATLMIAIISCTGTKSQKEKLHSGVEYYRDVQFSETPYDIEKGIRPLTEADAKKINSYKFTYDDAGKLLSVEYQRNNVLLDYSSVGAAKITYTYNGNIQTKQWFNSKNEQIQNG